jgi:hypothetical protein
MKLSRLISAIFVMAALAACIIPAFAQTPVTEAVTVPIAGTATWTNTRD